MKTIIFILFSFGSVAFAGPNSSKDLKEIFDLINSGKTKAAEEKFNKRPTIGYRTDMYETPNEDRTVCAGTNNMDCQDANIEDSTNQNVKGWMDAALDFTQECQNLLNELKGIKSEKIKVETEEEANSVADIEEKFENIQRDFKSHCLLQANPDEEYAGQPGHVISDSLKMIKKYVGVDFFPRLDSYKVTFPKEVSRVKAELAHLNKRVEGVADKLDKQETKKQQAILNNPKLYETKICEYQDQINLAHTVIARENEVGRTSGFVDKAKLHRAGQIIQSYTELKASAQTQYKKKFGKTLTTNQCK